MPTNIQVMIKKIAVLRKPIKFPISMVTFNTNFVSLSIMENKNKNNMSTIIIPIAVTIIR